MGPTCWLPDTESVLNTAFGTSVYLITPLPAGVLDAVRVEGVITLHPELHMPEHTVLMMQAAKTDAPRALYTHYTHT